MSPFGTCTRDQLFGAERLFLRKMAMLARPVVTRYCPQLARRKGVAARYKRSRRQARKARRSPGAPFTMGRLDQHHWVSADGAIYYQGASGALVPIT